MSNGHWHAEAIALYESNPHWTYEAIGVYFGVSREGAYRAIKCSLTARGFLPRIKKPKPPPKPKPDPKIAQQKRSEYMNKYMREVYRPRVRAQKLQENLNERHLGEVDSGFRAREEQRSARRDPVQVSQVHPG